MSVFEGLFATTKRLWPAELFKGRVLNFRLLLLGLTGVALLVVGSLTGPSSDPPRTAPAEQIKGIPVAQCTYEEALEAKLANLLSQVKGAGSVAVNVTLEYGGTQEYAKNVVRESRIIQEKDTTGGTRTTTESKENEQVLLSKENGIDKPVMVRELKPMIKGVLVIAEGAGDSTVKANLTRAVEAGLGIAPYKITVLPQRR